jgi:hypothetical protein
MPAKAGIQMIWQWIPAFAGMTGRGLKQISSLIDEDPNVYPKRSFL